MASFPPVRSVERALRVLQTLVGMGLITMRPR